jgi:hypothetical protein
MVGRIRRPRQSCRSRAPAFCADGLAGEACAVRAIRRACERHRGQRLGPAQAASASARPFAERGFRVPGLGDTQLQIAGSVCGLRVESDVLCAFQPRVLARRVRSPP